MHETDILDKEWKDFLEHYPNIKYEIIDFSFPTRCIFCSEYFVLNADLFSDCPCCEEKVFYDLEDRDLVKMCSGF